MTAGPLPAAQGAILVCRCLQLSQEVLTLWQIFAEEQDPSLTDHLLPLSAEFCTMLDENPAELLLADVSQADEILQALFDQYLIEYSPFSTYFTITHVSSIPVIIPEPVVDSSPRLRPEGRYLNVVVSAHDFQNPPPVILKALKSQLLSEGAIVLRGLLPHALFTTVHEQLVAGTDISLLGMHNGQIRFQPKQFQDLCSASEHALRWLFSEYLLPLVKMAFPECDFTIPEEFEDSYKLTGSPAQVPHADSLYAEHVRVLISLNSGFACTEVLPRDHQSQRSLPYHMLEVNSQNRVKNLQQRENLNKRFAPLRMDGVWAGDRLPSEMIPVTPSGQFEIGDVFVFCGDIIHHGPMITDNHMTQEASRHTLFMTLNPQSIEPSHEQQLHSVGLMQMLYGYSADQVFHMIDIMDAVFPNHAPHITEPYTELSNSKAFVSKWRSWKTHKAKADKHTDYMGF
eukprot:CRZ02826.1 hypothetical protein [Spongospora subterranea]